MTMYLTITNLKGNKDKPFKTFIKQKKKKHNN